MYILGILKITMCVLGEISTTFTHISLIIFLIWNFILVLPSVLWHLAGDR